MSTTIGEIKRVDMSYENRLVRALDRNGFSVCRLIKTSSPLPDVLAGDGESILIFQIETSRDSNIHIEKRKIWILKKFAGDLKADPWLALKFIDQHVGWLFCNLSALKIHEDTFSINYETAALKGFNVKKLVSNELQQRLI